MPFSIQTRAISKKVWVPPHQQEGHPVKGYWRRSKPAKSALKPDLPRFVDSKLKDQGGLTVQRFSGKEPHVGFSVAVAPSESLDIGPDVPDDKARDMIVQWVHEHTRKRGPSFDDKNVYLGGWLDQSTGHVWMDVVKVFPPDQKDRAIEAGKRANQIAIFDLERMEEISTGGTGAVAKAAKVRFLAPFDCDPEDFADWIIERRHGISKGDRPGHAFRGNQWVKIPFKDILTQIASGSNLITVGDMRIAIHERKGANRSDRGYAATISTPDTITQMQGLESSRAAAVLEALKQHQRGGGQKLGAVNYTYTGNNKEMTYSGLRPVSQEEAQRFVNDNQMEEDVALGDGTTMYARLGSSSIEAKDAHDSDEIGITADMAIPLLMVKEPVERLLGSRRHNIVLFDTDDLDEPYGTGSHYAGQYTPGRRGNDPVIAIATEQYGGDKKFIAHTWVHESAHAWDYEVLRKTPELEPVSEAVSQLFKQMTEWREGFEESNYQRTINHPDEDFDYDPSVGGHLFHAWEYAAGWDDKQEFLADLIAMSVVDPETLEDSINTIPGFDREKVNEIISAALGTTTTPTVSKLSLDIMGLPRHLGVREGEHWEAAAVRWRQDNQLAKHLKGLHDQKLHGRKGLLGRVFPVKEIRQKDKQDFPEYNEAGLQEMRVGREYVKGPVKPDQGERLTDLVDEKGKRHRLNLGGRLRAAHWLAYGSPDARPKDSIVVRQEGESWDQYKSRVLGRKKSKTLPGTLDRKGMPGFRHFSFLQEAGTNPANEMLTQMTDNLRALQKVAEQRQEQDHFITRTRQWYDGANSMAADLADQYDMDPDAAAGVIATLSPSMDWDNNVFMAKELLKLINTPGRTVDQDALDRLDALVTELNTDPETGKRKKPSARGYVTVEKPDPDSTWLGVKDEKTRALLARVLISRDWNNEPRTTKQRITLDGIIEDIPGDTMKTRFQSGDNMAKAISIALTPTKENLDAQLGQGIKVRSFYNNIAYPNSEARDVTIDTHAASSLVGAPWAANDEPFKSITESSTKEDGALVKQMMIEAFRIIADENPQWYTYPREAQSVLWELWREAAEKSDGPSKKRKAQLKEAWAAVDVPGVDVEFMTGQARKLMVDFVAGPEAGPFRGDIHPAEGPLVKHLPGLHDTGKAVEITEIVPVGTGEIGKGEEDMGNLGPVEAVVHHDGPDTDDSEEDIDAENEAWDRVLEKQERRERIRLG